jgi:mono/diheme cytochrome c family protein
LSKAAKHLGKGLLFAVGSLMLTSCFFEAASTDLSTYRLDNPSYAHDPQIQMLINDFGGLNSETLQTNAIPLKIVATAVAMRRHDQSGESLSKDTFLRMMKENGFITPKKIENLKAGVPVPKLEYPVGLIRGEMKINTELFILSTEVGNITCAACHAGRTYDSSGRPTQNVWLGSPNSSINLQGYTQEVYDSLKYISDPRLKKNFLNNLKVVYPDISLDESQSIEDFFYGQVVKQIKVFADSSDKILAFFNGPPGNANAIGAFKRVLGIYKPGDYNDKERGFVNVPDLSYREFRRNLTVDGIYTPLGETPLTPVTAAEATFARAQAISPVAAIFLVPVMGQSAARAELQIPELKNAFASFVADYEHPRFPGSLDSQKALAGEQIYRNNCMHCHGEYAPGINFPKMISYPNALIPIKTIGTDPLRLNVVTSDLVAKMDATWINKKVQTNMHNGYMAPPLANIWSTAPYLHNGSIPTLWALMNPELRPAKFYVGGHALDFTDVGISYPEGYQPWSKPVLYDTSLDGQSNKGHEWQFQPLSQDDKRALIEYLKVL